MNISTHDVHNQSEPYVDVNLYGANRPLQQALRALHPGHGVAHFEQLGAELGSAAMQRHARLAHAHRPVLRTHDRDGRRLDEVEFHPSYHALMARALHHGLHGTPWSRPPGGHIERAAAFMLFTELEPAVLCPVSMTYAAAPALRGNPAVAEAWLPALASTTYDGRDVPHDRKPAVTIGMGMTEKQGGSDVRANATRAVPDGVDAWGPRYRLTGHKWFWSAPMSDAHVVMAQAPEGLTCLLVPRLLPGWCEDGPAPASPYALRHNGVRLQRLKDKLGNHANASAEVEFEGTIGWRLGDAGRGLPQILAMGTLTRLDCALGTAGLMRHALSLALHHAQQRRAFGRTLVELPLMRRVLADLALESEAATLLALRLAAAVDRSEHADDRAAGAHEALLRRVLTPVAKFWICKRGAAFAQEAMECVGGNGYVEAAGEGVMARLYREMPLNALWEGAGNVMALDLLRALRSGPVAEALEVELAPGRGVHPAFDHRVAALLRRLDAVVDEGDARAVARDVALLVQAALLARLAPPAVTEAWCASRLDGACDVYGLLPSGIDVDTILERARPT